MHHPETSSCPDLVLDTVDHYLMVFRESESLSMLVEDLRSRDTGLVGTRFVDDGRDIELDRARDP
jgi:hypothetical protein